MTPTGLPFGAVLHGAGYHHSHLAPSGVGLIPRSEGESMIELLAFTVIAMSLVLLPACCLVWVLERFEW